MAELIISLMVRCLFILAGVYCIRKCLLPMRPALVSVFRGECDDELLAKGRDPFSCKVLMGVMLLYGALFMGSLFWCAVTMPFSSATASTSLSANEASEPSLPLDSWPRPKLKLMATAKQSNADTGYVVDPMNEKPKPMI